MAKRPRRARSRKAAAPRKTARKAAGKAKKARKSPSRRAVRTGKVRKTARRAARTARKSTARKSTARRTLARSGRRAARTPKLKRTVRAKPAPKAPAPKPVPRKAPTTPRTVARRSPPPPKPAAPAPTPSAPIVAKAPAARARSTRPATPPPALQRERRRLPDAEAFPPSPPSSLDLDRHPSAARSGQSETREHLHEHNEASPVLTAGDVDADWEQAYASGDEAPGGDNPTPDQDIVDEIGRSLGLEYDDDEELKGAGKLEERDKHRWELDPASAEDFEDRED